MATNTYTTGTSPAAGFGAHRFAFVIDNVLDAAAANQGAGDTGQLLTAGAGYWALGIGLQVLTKEGGTCTADFGDGTDPDGFLDGVDLNTGTEPVRYASRNAWTDATDAGNVEAGVATQLFGTFAGKFYSAADTIDVLTNNAADLYKIRLTALMVNMDGSGQTS